MFEVWILISSGSDIYHNSDSNTWFWSDLIGQQLGAPYTEPADCIQDTIYRSWNTQGKVAAVLSLLQDFVLQRQVKQTVWTNGWCEGILCRSVLLSPILSWAGGSKEAGRYVIILSRDKDCVQMSGSLASAAKWEAWCMT